MAKDEFSGRRTQSASPLALTNSSRVGVIGGGPAGSFFSFFFLEAASRVDLEAHVDIYEPKIYTQVGPGGCNMCGGIVSESLVQLLATEGINLPSTIVQRGIDSYVLHMDVGSVRIDPPGREKRIAAVHRGAGPRGLPAQQWGSFDGYLLEQAQSKGAAVIHDRAEDVAWEDGRPRVVTKRGLSEPYDLLAFAVGVNSGAFKLLEKLGFGYSPPKTTKTFICEFHMGAEVIAASLGSSMHVFLLNLPRLEFAALIPKGEYVTLVLLGKDIDKELVASFLNAPEVKRSLPSEWSVPQDYCRCFPSINVGGPPQPFADRMVFLGDCGETRLYKDGIGGAYRAAKAAASTAVFEGVSADDFRRHYMPVCRSLAFDNSIGKVIFAVTGLIQSLRFTRRGILRMVSGEQRQNGQGQMSGVLWDTFTGSAAYRDVFGRTLHPLFVGRLLWDTALGFTGVKPQDQPKQVEMRSSELGRLYRAGETIVRQGEVGDCMYVIQSGKVEVIKEQAGSEVSLAELGEGDFFGEMALFEKDVRSATVRALGDVRVLTVDQKILLRKIHEDPSLAFRIIRKLSQRIRGLDAELLRITGLRLEEQVQALHWEA